MPTAGTPLAASEGRPHFSAVWVWDNSANAYINNTLESQLVGGTTFTVLEATADYLYLGNESRFDLAYFNLAIAGSLGTLTWQHWDGSAWTQFAPGRSYTYATGSDPGYVNYGFLRDGVETFDNLLGWAGCHLITTDHGSGQGVASPDAVDRYWIRVRSASSVTTAPTVNNIRCRCYAAYCTATDVANIMQLDTDFSSSTSPTRNAVEDAIHAAQSYIDHETQKSWRVNFVLNEHHEYRASGITLVRSPAWKVLSLEVWNGSEWDAKEEGRNQDYFFTPDYNLLMFSRYFLLPARFQSVASSLGWWGWGEFVHPVRISYLYGGDIFTNEREGGMVFDVARKMAAIDVWQSHDYSIMSVSGSDKVPLERKIQLWRDETERKLDSLKGWVVI